MVEPVIEWGVAGSALAGQTQSGDLHVVKPFPGGLLLAVIDGLGHGDPAAVAARAAADVIDDWPLDASLELARLMSHCHQQLTPTRGAVMSLAALDGRRGDLAWLGVGNVEGVLVRGGTRGVGATQSLRLHGGIVGGRLPPLRPSSVGVARGNTVIMATDGIRAGFADRIPPADTAQGLASCIMAQHARGTDDALVLVARWIA